MLTAAELNVGFNAQEVSLFFKGYIFEQIHYPSALSAGDNLQAISYLLGRWGI
jgi:hypothetical protein